MFKDAFDLGPAPALLCAPEAPTATGAPLGVVLHLHALGGAKEDCIDDLERFAEHGFCALAIDAAGHGARWSDTLQERLDDPVHRDRAFTELVLRSAAELPALIDALEAAGWLDSSRVGLVGYSFGACVALTAPRFDPRVAVVVSIAGTPRWTHHSERSPLSHLDAYWPTALLVLHGEADETVDPAGGAELVDALRSRYAADPARLERVTFAGAGHILTPLVWQEAIGRALTFCARFLPPS